MSWRILLAALYLLPIALAAQTAPITTRPAITADDEPHHHLVLKNDVVKVFEIDLASHDAFSMHRHDYDEIVVVIGDAATVSTTPDHADILTMSRIGQVLFARGGRSHSVRNIGQTAYRAVAIDLLRPQTSARNLCGKQIPDLPANCPAAPPTSIGAPRMDQPQFETDQTRVTLTRILPHQAAPSVKSSSDELLVSVDQSVVAAGSGTGTGKLLMQGDFVWIGHRNPARMIRNDSDAEARIVTVEFKP